jgi:uncharacterized protein YqeY
MNLQLQIKEDMVATMRAKESEKLTLLRVLSGELATNEKRKEKEKLEEQEIVRKMSNNAKEMGNDFEVEILDKYIIKIVMLTEEQTKLAVNSIIQEKGYSTMKDMGAVMKEIKQLGTAPQIDMKIASGIVKEKLG